MSAEALQAEVDALRQKRKDLSNEKAAYLADYREQALELKVALDTLVAEAAAAATVEAMSAEDRQAIGAELVKLGDN